MHEPVVVFLGPTLRLERARELLDALYLPPAEQGSIVDAVQRVRPGTIVLIDGAFVSVPAVRHKEILWALSQGIEVIGASSLGAIRAAELAGFGMKGHGLIYRWFRAVPLADDDEVAVAMAPPELGAGPLGDALIDMRIAFRRAERAGVVPAELRRLLVDLARETHFLQRSYGDVLAQASQEGPAQWASNLQALAAWLRDHAVSQKQIDAIGLLHRIGTRAARTVGLSSEEPLPFTLTEAFVYDLDAAGLDIIGLSRSAKGVGAVTDS